MKSQQTQTTDSSSNLDSIGEALDLTPITVLPKQTLPTTIDHVDDDYEYARGNIIATIEKGNEALNGILDVAGLGQHLRAYEVAANLVKTMVEANKELLDLNKKKKEIEKIEGKGAAQTVNNNLFVGSTAELQRMIKEMNKKPVDEQ